MESSITLAMIVRDEAEKLARCLRSIEGAVDEVHVVDTGSTDESVEVARRYGARVREIEWPHAFDVARNASLEAIETEWVLWLDADEWLVEGAGPAIRAAADSEAAGLLLIRRDILPGSGHTEQHLLRLWRHDPSLKFEGAIHEHLDLGALTQVHGGRAIVATSIPIWHDGYSPELSPAKAARNLPLLRREIEKRSRTLYYEIELAQTLKALGDSEWKPVHESLADRIAGLRDQDHPPDNTIALFLMRHFADLADEELKTERTDILLRVSRGWFPNHPGVRYLCAQVEIRRGDLRSAFDDLSDVERMAATGDYDRLTTTSPVMLGEGLSTNLALVAHQLGKFDAARRHYRRLLELVPNHPLAMQNLPKLLG